MAVLQIVVTLIDGEVGLEVEEKAATVAGYIEAGIKSGHGFVRMIDRHGSVHVFNGRHIQHVKISEVVMPLPVERQAAQA